MVSSCPTTSGREGNMRRLKLVLAVLGSSLVTAGAHAADPVKIRVSWIVAPSDWASVLVEKRDLLTHNGKSYVVEPMRFNGTPALITAMAANELEIGNHSYSSLGIAIQNAGMSDLRVIADQLQDGVPGYFST